MPRRPVLQSILMLTLLAACACKQKAVQSMAGPPVVPVTVATAAAETIPFELRVVGTVDAFSIVQIKSQVAGQILSVNFTEGQNVAKNALLFQIDPQPYRDALAQAEAAVTRDQAQIRQAEATLSRDQTQEKTARSDEARYAALVKSGVISASQYEQYRMNADVYHESARASQASIETARATLESDKAAVERAKLDLAYCQIRAPISGRTGNVLVQAGNLVKVNDVPMVVIHQVAPIFVYFSVPERHLGAIRRLSAAHKLPVRAYPRDNPQRAATGALSVIDNTVDPATGTIRLKAVFDNQDGALWPGQFVNVVLTLEAIANATVIPAEAVQPGQQGQFVYVVKAGGAVENRVVTAGASFERKVVIEKGIAPGEVVVTDGQLRLFPGATVKIVDAGIVDKERPQTATP